MGLRRIKKKKNASKTLVDVCACRSASPPLCPYRFIISFASVVAVVFKILSSHFFFLFLGPCRSSVVHRFGLAKKKPRKLQLTGVNASSNVKRIILLVPKQNETENRKAAAEEKRYSAGCHHRRCRRRRCTYVHTVVSAEKRFSIFTV